MKDPPSAASGGRPSDGGLAEEGGKEEGEKGGEEGGEKQAAAGEEAQAKGGGGGQGASLSREPPTMKPEGSESPASESAPSEEAPPPVKVKTESPEEEEAAVWPEGAEGPKKVTRGTGGGAPAEICVVLGGVRSQQSLGSYECGICGKKYKYYNCFQTHVRAHRDTEAASGEGASQGNNFRYTCDICGKKYKYYSCFQEHRDLHAVDDPYDQALVTKDEVKEEDPEPFQKIGPKTGSYTCEFCGKQYKYYTPYQEHVALHAPIKSVFSRRVESKLQNNYDETNSSSQNSSEPYTCGACGIQFQFYNNLLEHMQSHAADNENSLTSPPPRSPPPAPPEEKWKPPAQQGDDALPAAAAATLPEKERQSLAEKLLRLLCAEPSALGALTSPEFLPLAQSLVESGARHGAYSAAEALGNLSALALQQLPRMYNQAKVKVTCALGSSAGVGLTCHAQNGASSSGDSCHILSAHRAEAGRLRSYVLAVRGHGPEPPHRWAQNVLSEFITPETRTAYVTDGPTAAAAKGGLGLRCASCALNAAVGSVLSQRALQARGMPEVAELLGLCQDMAAAPETGAVTGTPTPPCWASPADALLAVHERYEQICEFYNRAKEGGGAGGPALNRQLLGNLAALLAPVKQAVFELGAEGRPTLQLVLPTYVRLEKLFTARAGDAGPVSKLCHLFLEALKENFKVHAAHKAAMLLDPRQKLRPVPPYQHEEIVANVCQLLCLTGEDEAEPAEPAAAKKSRTEPEEAEVYAYLQEPLSAASDLFQFWAAAKQHPRLAKLASWLLAVPAVGARASCGQLCEQALLLRRRRLLSPEDTNKLMFLKANLL